MSVTPDRTIAGALRNAIDAHGPITPEWVGSAAKRVRCQLQADLLVQRQRNRDLTRDLRLERRLGNTAELVLAYVAACPPMGRDVQAIAQDTLAYLDAERFAPGQVGLSPRVEEALND